MLEKLKQTHLLVCVGSRSDQVCSIGAFARAEANAFREIFGSVNLIEPSAAEKFPDFKTVTSNPDFILLHSPSLHDRKKPWNALTAFAKIRFRFPKAIILPVVHEYSEAPWHWRARQRTINALSSGVIVNSSADEAFVKSQAMQLLRVPLGPTLFEAELTSNPDEQKLKEKMAHYRLEISKKFKLNPELKWILHPGLVTPGKGVNFLSKLRPILNAGEQLIVMGGLGPKEKDRAFAAQVIQGLKRDLGERFVFIEAPSDEWFGKMLTASDLVLLPYDVGVSERRSSFLSAMSCGANVWSTSGMYSGPLNLDKTAVHLVSASIWMESSAEVGNSIKKALLEDENKKIARRISNLKWAKTRSWALRTAKMGEFFLGLSKRS